MVSSIFILFFYFVCVEGVGGDQVIDKQKGISPDFSFF